MTKAAHTDGLYCMSAKYVVETVNDNQYTLYVDATWKHLSIM